jgi:hypothetical protein
MSASQATQDPAREASPVSFDSVGQKVLETIDTADGLAGMFGVLDHATSCDDFDNTEWREEVSAMLPWLRRTTAALADTLRELQTDIFEVERNVLRNPVVADGGAR